MAGGDKWSIKMSLNIVNIVQELATRSRLAIGSSQKIWLKNLQKMR